MKYAAYEIIRSHKQEIVSLFTKEIKEKYPTRTTQFEKCKRDMEIVIDAYVAGLRDNSDFEIKFVISRYYENNKLQIRSSTVEIEYHTRLRDKLLELITETSDEERATLFQLSELFLNDLANGPSEFNILNIEKIVMNRATQYCFYDTQVSDNDIKTILRAANGVTPALCNQYDYRVDVIPNNLKQAVFKSAITVDTDKSFSGNINDIREEYSFNGFNDDYRKYKNLVCLNPQVFAPLVLCFSFPDIAWETNKTVGRDQSILAMAFSIWHTVMVCEELGLNHAFCAGFDKYYAKNLLGLTEPTSDTVYYPHLFLCIGYGEEAKDVHRLSKHNDILNKLILKDGTL